MNRYGYVRVSSADQNEERQMIELARCGIEKENIYIDKVSGKDFNRKSYGELMKKLEKGDVLYVLSIDRLGRDYREILEQWQKITKELCADIVVVDMPLLDTRNGKDLLGTFIADLVLQILSFVAQNERENIKLRQQQGICAARQRGVVFGRPKKVPKKNLSEVIVKTENGEIKAVHAAKLCGMSRSTFYRRRIADRPKTKKTK